MAPGQRVVHVVAVIQVESFLGAQPDVPQATQLDRIRFFVTEQRIGQFVPLRLGPQPILARVRVPHLQVVQGDFHAVPGALVRPDRERLALYTITNVLVLRQRISEDNNRQPTLNICIRTIFVYDVFCVYRSAAYPQDLIRINEALMAGGGAAKKLSSGEVRGVATICA